eukprot:197940_1
MLLTSNNTKGYTVDEAISLIGVGLFQYKILTVTGLIWAADAIEMMILTFLIPILADEWQLNNAEDGTIGAVVFVGLLIGQFFWSNISDRFGRRMPIIISNLGQIIFGMLSATSWNLYSMIIFRFITGFFIGASSCSYTLYAEYAPKADRGKLLLLNQVFWSFGALFNSLLAWLVLETLNWRWYLILSSLPLCIILYLAIKLPESAVYLVMIGKIEEAEMILNNAMKLNKKDYDYIKLDEQRVIIEKRGNFSEIFADKYFETSINLFIIMFITTFTYYGISFLSERFFDQLTSGENDTEKYWKVVVTTSSELPGIIIGMFVLDVIGRKMFMVIAYGICGVCMLCLINIDIQNIEWLSLILVFVGRMCAIMVFYVLYIYFTEYYPTQIRNTSLGFANGLARFGGMMATYVAQSGNIAYAFYLIGLAAVCGCVASYLLKQDTTGKDLSNNKYIMPVEKSMEGKEKGYLIHDNIKC